MKNLVDVSDDELLDEVRRRWPRYTFPPIPEIRTMKRSEFLALAGDAAATEMSNGPINVVSDDDARLIMQVSGQYRPIPCDCLCEPCQLCRNRYEDECDD